MGNLFSVSQEKPVVVPRAEPIQSRQSRYLAALDQEMHSQDHRHLDAGTAAPHGAFRKKIVHAGACYWVYDDGSVFRVNDVDGKHIGQAFDTMH